MVVTLETTLPTEEELTVPEINISWPVLHAASFYIGKCCEHQNNEFMLCRAEEQDPRKCINEGKDVTSCSMNLLKKMKKHCRQEFDQFYNCVYRSSYNASYMPCRKTQAVLDKCMADNVGVERPPFGYFAEVKVHDSKRPKPVDDLPVYEPTDSLSANAPKPDPRFGVRFLWEY